MPTLRCSMMEEAMTTHEFYVFCRDHRKIESDQQKREVLQDVYGYMRECGVSKKGVLWYIEQRIHQEQGDESKITAYQWLREQFERIPQEESVTEHCLFTGGGNDD